MSQFKTAKYNSLMLSSVGGMESFLLSKGSLFVVLSYASQQSSVGIVVERMPDLNTQLKIIYDTAVQKSKADQSKIEAKLICSSASFLKAASSQLKVLGVSKVQEVVKDSDLEIIYTLSPVRVRVAPVLKSRPVALANSAPSATALQRQKSGKVRVLIVDDSKTIRQLLTQILGSDSEIEIVGTAEKPSVAMKMIEEFQPDVITLDIHMPEMDGVTFLKNYLPKYPIPTVMISSISLEEGPIVLQALESGAVDYIQKPGLAKLEDVAPIMIEKVKQAAQARVRKDDRVQSKLVIGQEDLDMSKVLAIGSSTGGTEALRVLLTGLPDQIPPTVIVQHIPPVFSKAFADRMNQLCSFEVREAADGDELAPSLVLVAPGGKQMKLIKSTSGSLRVKIDDSPPVNRHRPSVDFLFDSVAELLGKQARGVILTGMGADGARGLLNMKKAGAFTIAQDEASCVVFGMPREAIKLGAADKILPLTEIARELVMQFSRKKTAA
jgi:two-component system chemotaxis response regulator CheB